ncbi:MAG: hypothetical protein U1F68_01275 [Gammaproteobacteria bacterium]
MYAENYDEYEVELPRSVDDNDEEMPEAPESWTLDDFSDLNYSAESAVNW